MKKIRFVKLPQLGNGINNGGPKESEKPKTEESKTTSTDIVEPKGSVEDAKRVDWGTTQEELQARKDSIYKQLTDFPRLKNKSMAEINKLKLEYGELTDEQAIEISEGLNKAGYGFKAVKIPSKTGGSSFGFERKISGLSSSYSNRREENKGFQNGVMYEDGEWEAILDDAQYAEIKKQYEASKTTGNPVYVPITEQSSVFRKKLNKGIDTTEQTDTTKQLSGGIKSAAESIPVYGQLIGAANSMQEGLTEAVGGDRTRLGEALQEGRPDKAIGNLVTRVKDGDFLGAGANILTGGASEFAGPLLGIKSPARKRKEAEEDRLLKEKSRNEYLSKFNTAQNTQSNMYELGTAGANMSKPVEVEKDEIVLQKNALGKYTIKADFKGGKSHEEGGEPYILEKGDVVFPGFKRRTILRNLENGNHAKIESERLKLPKELPSKELKNGINAAELISYAPAVANVVRGLQKPEKVKRESYNPEVLKYTDKSENLRQQIEEQTGIDIDNATRFSGGSAQVAKANKALAGMARFKKMQSVDAQEQQRADAINSANVEIRNQAKGTNIDLKNKYDELDDMNKAAVDAYFDQGIYDIGRIGSQIQRDRQMNKMQDIMLKNIDTDNYYYDPITGERKLKPEYIIRSSMTSIKPKLNTNILLTPSLDISKVKLDPKTGKVVR